MKKIRLNKVADLDKVVKICGALGDNYTPGNEALMPAALASLRDVVYDKVKAVNSAHETATVLTKTRFAAFKGIPNLATKIVQMVASSRVSVGEAARAREIKRHYFGSSLGVSGTKTPETENSDSSKKSLRVNFRDYTGQLTGLELLIELVSGISSYRAQEPALQLPGLRAKFAELQALHVATIKAKLDLVQARQVRNTMVVSIVTTTVGEFKSYMRAKFGYGKNMIKQR